MFDAFKKKTVEDIVETAKDTVTEVVNTGIDEKVKGVVMLLPVVVAGFMIFSGNSKHDKNDLPDRVVINNYYYGKDDIHDSNNC